MLARCPVCRLRFEREQGYKSLWFALDYFFDPERPQDEGEE